MSDAPVPGSLVVVPAEPALGVGRLERIVEVEGRLHARVLFYDDGRLLLRPIIDVIPCPAGVWDRSAKPR